MEKVDWLVDGAVAWLVYWLGGLSDCSMSR